MRLLRGPDALGTTAQEWGTVTGSALADMLQVMPATWCVRADISCRAHATRWNVMPGTQADCGPEYSKTGHTRR